MTFLKSKISVRRGRPKICDTYASVDHESKDILYTIKSQDPSIDALPHMLIIHVAPLNCSPQPIYELWIGDRDLEICCFLIALKAEQILALDDLNRVDHRLMLGQLRLQVRFKASAICRAKRDWRSYVEVV